ncbi:cobalamin-5'-phosphate synthase [Thermostaphylospora chromogena]|uniref:Adenosylcobinamide-GDP ribazoletransferase n=2 Tax=Thermostaphylospora chromogena TaxID=35622 RepID=A0A1H1G3D1_9ACTN|nr:cobalamin-5'-phosphate synthase [Thermostaphylospora chromogena]
MTPPRSGRFPQAGATIAPMSASDGLRLAVSLLSVVPAHPRRVDRRTAGLAMILAPVVGAGLGLAAAAVMAGTRWLGEAGPLPAVLAVAALALLTRGLHLDGLADLADGLGSGKPASGALEVMRRSDIGPFGVVTLVFTVLVQVAALTSAGTPLALVTACATGRLALTWACREGVPAARPDGLGATVAGTVRRGAALAVTALVLVAAALGGLAEPRLAAVLPAAVLAGLAAAWGVRRHAVRRLGGVTGDVLGALVEISVTAALLVCALAR